PDPHETGMGEGDHAQGPDHPEAGGQGDVEADDDADMHQIAVEAHQKGRDKREEEQKTPCDPVRMFGDVHCVGPAKLNAVPRALDPRKEVDAQSQFCPKRPEGRNTRMRKITTKLRMMAMSPEMVVVTTESIMPRIRPPTS